MQRSRSPFRDHSSIDSGRRIAATALAPGGFCARSVLSLLVCACVLSACNGDGDGPGPGAEEPKLAVCGAAVSSAVPQAVFVSTTGSDDSGCGTTTASACKSLQQGIDNCAAPGCAVFVRHGLYATSATINLRNGISVHGSCRFDGEADHQYRTVINAAPAPGTAAVGAAGVSSPTLFDGIVVIGKDETASGSASIAMAVSNSNGLTLKRSVLVAGRGGDGAPAGQPSAGAAQGGGQGDASSFTAGGEGSGGPSCDAGGIAGRGGDGSARRQNTISGCDRFSLSCYCNEAGGLKGMEGADSGWVSAGSGGSSGTQGYACYEFPVIRHGTGGQGSTGGPGSAGACSTQLGVASADVWGSFQGVSWLPGAGGVGGSGDVGSGGGGGGPGGMCTLTTSDTREWFPYWGQPGGGGGAGGCAGPGGPGGQQGGASIALLLATSSMSLDPASLAVVGGQGGRGGPGATGGIGGAGGGGGAGGNAGTNCTQYNAIVNIGWGGPGGPGGSGGAGGAGSGGAGGNGGPSMGIALVGGSTAPGAGGIYPGIAGAGAGGGTGGSGGANNCAGVTGQGGIAGGMAVLRTF